MVGEDGKVARALVLIRESICELTGPIGPNVAIVITIVTFGQTGPLSSRMVQRVATNAPTTLPVSPTMITTQLLWSFHLYSSFR